ncbi:MAG: HAD-IIIC family phosphatase [Sulfitobacter sp.]|nr:HAD-IIIC family phosphatase [Sulfitobacter sp.]
MQAAHKASEEAASEEEVRLVIWDLDETFWHGTLSEEGMIWQEANADIVRQLARRGIPSAICSKNDATAVERVLREHGLWDWFIFPSIDWTPKGPRLAAMIEEIGLRAASVLFIDDNPANLAEAQAHVPGLQVALPTALADLVDRDALRGKPDPECRRLQQYGLKERKAQARATSGATHSDFLRQSAIKVSFEYDVEADLPRAVELINRTNQLNFTKARVADPEDLRRLLRHNTTDAALVRLRDRYGDYGIVGFYLCRRLHGERRLIHFCFSCRTLNMHLEDFVLSHLGRPRLDVVGEVRGDPVGSPVVVDWVSLEQDPGAAASGPATYDTILARGGCDLAAVIHYLAPHGRSSVEEFNGPKNDQMFRRDHSAFLLPALRGGLEPAETEAAIALGYDPEDFETDLFDRKPDRCLILLSFWADADIPRYRHGATGLELCYWLIGAQHHDLIARADLRENLAQNPAQRRRLGHLASNYSHLGIPSEAEMVRRYGLILDRIGPTRHLALMLANEVGPAGWDSGQRHAGHARLNRALRRASAGRPNVALIDPAQAITGRDDLIDLNHFRREVYWRLAQQIRSAFPDLAASA